MKVRVIKSKKRKRTASARVEDGVLLIRVPAGLAENRIKSLVEKFKKSVKHFKQQDIVKSFMKRSK